MLTNGSFVLTALWAASRVAYRLAGVKFDTIPLEYAFQFLDEDLLRHDLLRSLWHLHAQPPLFNLVLGLIHKLPLDPGQAFGALYRLLGLALALVSFRLLTELGVGKHAACGASALLVCAPSTVLYENYLSYTYPVAVLLPVAALALLRFLRAGRLHQGFTAFMSLAAIALMRSTYHLVWLLVIAATVALVAKGRLPPRRIALSLIPVLLVVGWYAKNQVLFGSFSSSSWLGMNLARMTLVPADPDVIEALIDDGTLSEQARTPPFFPIEDYPDVPLRTTGITTLDRKTRSDGHPNLNHLAYVEISDRYLADSVAFIRERPADYLDAVQVSLRFSALPSSDYPFLDRNARHIRGLDRATWALGGLQLRTYEDRRGILDPTENAPTWTQISWTVVGAYLLVVLAPPAMLIRGRRRRRSGEAPLSLDRGALTVFGVAGFTAAFVELAGIALEIGENNRFRFETDPLVFLVAFAVVARAVGALRSPVAVALTPPGG